jgi:hypothetical protein
VTGRGTTSALVHDLALQQFIGVRVLRSRKKPSHTKKMCGTDGEQSREFVVASQDRAVERVVAAPRNVASRTVRLRNWTQPNFPGFPKPTKGAFRWPGSQSVFPTEPPEQPWKTGSCSEPSPEDAARPERFRGRTFVTILWNDRPVVRFNDCPCRRPSMRAIRSPRFLAGRTGSRRGPGRFPCASRDVPSYRGASGSHQRDGQ